MSMLTFAKQRKERADALVALQARMAAAEAARYVQPAPAVEVTAEAEPVPIAAEEPKAEEVKVEPPVKTKRPYRRKSTEAQDGDDDSAE